MALNLARKELKLLLKEKGTFFWLLLMPILFIVLFGSALNHIGDEAISVPYIDQDQTPASQSFLDDLAAKSGFVLQSRSPERLEEQLDQIRNGKSLALIVIPKGFGGGLASDASRPTIELYRDAASESATAPIRAVLENMDNAYRESKISGVLGAAGISDAEREQLLAPPFDIRDHRENAVSFDMVSQVVPGYTVMFVFFVIISMIRRFISDKESGMTARLRSTRMSPLTYLLGMWIPYLIVVLVQCAVLLAFGHAVYGVNLGDLGAMAAIVFVLAICGTAFGLALSVWVKSQNQGLAFTQLIAMGGAVLGGLWFPVDLMPKTMQTIGHFTPQYWAQKSLLDVMVRGAHLGAVWPSLAMLAVFAAVGLAIALLRFNRFVKTATN